MKRQPNNNGGFSLLEVILAMAILAIISIPLLSYFTQSMKYNAMMADKQHATNLAQEVLEDLKNQKNWHRSRMWGQAFVFPIWKERAIPCSLRLRRLPRHRHFRRRMCTTHRQAFLAGRMMSRFPSVRLQLKMTPISHRSKGSMTQKMLWHWNITSCRKQ